MNLIHLYKWFDLLLFANLLWTLIKEASINFHSHPLGSSPSCLSLIFLVSRETWAFINRWAGLAWGDGTDANYSSWHNWLPPMHYTFFKVRCSCGEYEELWLECELLTQGLTGSKIKKYSCGKKCTLAYLKNSWYYGNNTSKYTLCVNWMQCFQNINCMKYHRNMNVIEIYEYNIQWKCITVWNIFILNAISYA